MSNSVRIAIDGPAGAGKSTIARRVAARLGFVYIDTGAMYRAVALAALRSDTALDDAPTLESLARDSEIQFEPGATRVLLNGEDVSEAIRRPEISPAASKVSALPGVRRAMVDKQRELAAHHSVVMEGRDIGTVVFPDAGVKIYLDASPEVRAARRVLELAEKGIAADAAEVAREIHERDLRDSTRADSPLRPAADAIHVDTTGLSLDQVESAILKIIADRTSHS